MGWAKRKKEKDLLFLPLSGSIPTMIVFYLLFFVFGLCEVLCALHVSKGKSSVCLVFQFVSWALACPHLCVLVSLGLLYCWTERDCSRDRGSSL